MFALFILIISEGCDEQYCYESTTFIELKGNLKKEYPKNMR